MGNLAFVKLRVKEKGQELSANIWGRLELLEVRRRPMRLIGLTKMTCSKNPLGSLIGSKSGHENREDRPSMTGGKGAGVGHGQPKEEVLDLRRGRLDQWWMDLRWMVVEKRMNLVDLYGLLAAQIVEGLLGGADLS
jgi:hypothetical protein